MIPGTSTTLNSQLAFVEGDTWGGIPSIIITPTPGPDVASARMHFRESWVSPRVLVRLDSANASEITIVSASDWEFTVPIQPLPLKAGNYVWQFETTDANGRVQTYLQGEIQVLSDIVTPT
jgi:hypothetical protein